MPLASFPPLDAQPAATLLDRPVWHSLTGPQRDLARGDALARRYHPEIHLFACAADDSPGALTALARLLPAQGSLYLLQAPPLCLPPGVHVLKEALGVQMLATRSLNDEPSHPDIQPLGDADAAEMLALAELTQPGPFLAQTHRMGRFLGVRLQGRLAAMAGERMHVAGHTEISGVCTHPDFRGLGLARQLSAAVARQIEARGERPFLHAWRSNEAAIALYESLGFRWRRDMQVAVIARAS
ncbi:GNAT family N-acetyltransferase [Mitsuaria sp. WAJ17]|uniref:GNAT family N-acetyltransferase n=1 Tax=Mitsuaria sp. WAJ17 TaxID=2761452 RepID=UPI0015FEDDD1|nr:GNAT family N-acetyltransferase [Mitsuaria sp. WAJ17]MBB2486750.1 GNAT family N-acetyltransferase [Mitsuaria sp. WAJ17]